MQDAVKVCSADPPFYTSHTTLESADYSWGHLVVFSIARLYDSAVERQTHIAGTPVKSMYSQKGNFISFYFSRRHLVQVNCLSVRTAYHETVFRRQSA